MDGFCRLCGQKSNEYINIFEEKGLSKGIGDKMSSCLQITVSCDDFLPKTICLSCYAKLETFYDFFEESHHAQILLYNLYQYTKFNQPMHKDNTNFENISEDIEQSNETDHCLSYPLCIKSEIIEDDCKDTFTLETHLPISGLDRVETNCDNLYTKEIKSEFFEEIISSSHEEKVSQKSNKDNVLTLASVLKNYTWPCTVCDNLSLKDYWDLCNHYKIEHCKPPIFKCDLCDRQYNIYASFTKHFKFHYNLEKYTCDICEKTFKRKASLHTHLVVHSDDRPHICSICGKSFKTLGSLTAHNILHLPDEIRNRFDCSVCKKKFSSKTALTVHSRVHNTVPNFICDICGKIYTTRPSLMNHILNHSEAKEYKCTLCDKKFNILQSLKKHKRAHAAMNRYKCDVCNKHFNNSYALKIHNRLHTGEKPHHCENCGKTFRLLAGLKTHKRQHTGEKPYSCPNCHRRFTNFSNYKKHVTHVHQIDTTNP